MISASKDGTIRVRNVQTGEEIRSFGTLQTNGDPKAKEESEKSKSAGGRLGTVSHSPAIALAADGKTLAFAFPRNQPGRFGLLPDADAKEKRSFRPTIEVWDLAIGKRLQMLTTDGGQIGALAGSPDHKLIAIRASDGAIHMLDLASGKEVYQLKSAVNRLSRGVGPNHCPSLVFSPDGKLLVTAGEEEIPNQPSERSLQTWDVQTPRNFAR